MQTIYDWVTIALFAALVVLFLERSMAEIDPVADGHNALAYYLVAAIGCAIVNYFGNRGDNIIAMLVLAATATFILIFLKPFHRITPR